MTFLLLFACAAAPVPSPPAEPVAPVPVIPTQTKLLAACEDHNKRLEQCQYHAGVSDLVPVARVGCKEGRAQYMPDPQKWAYITCSEGIYNSTNCLGPLSVQRMLDRREECASETLARMGVSPE